MVHHHLKNLQRKSGNLRRNLAFVLFICTLASVYFVSVFFNIHILWTLVWTILPNESSYSYSSHQCEKTSSSSVKNEIVRCTSLVITTSNYIHTLSETLSYLTSFLVLRLFPLLLRHSKMGAQRRTGPIIIVTGANACVVLSSVSAWTRMTSILFLLPLEELVLQYATASSSNLLNATRKMQNHNTTRHGALISKAEPKEREPRIFKVSSVARNSRSFSRAGTYKKQRLRANSFSSYSTSRLKE